MKKHNQLILFIPILFLIGWIVYQFSDKNGDRNVQKLSIESLRKHLSQAGPIESYEIPEDIVVGDLVELLNDPNKYVVLRSLNILGIVGNEDIVEPIARKLDSKEWLIRFHSADALSNIGSNRAVPYLEDAWLKETKWEVSHRIYMALSNIGGENIAKLFANTYQEDGRTEKWIFATIFLFQLTSNQMYLNDLFMMLETGDQQTQLLLLWAADSQKDRIFLPIFEKAKASQNPKVREFAIDLMDE